jgi:hypothetical protein
MIKTEIIGFCQKINSIVILVELSDTLTHTWRRRHGRCGMGEGRGKCFLGFVFCPQIF